MIDPAIHPPTSPGPNPLSGPAVSRAPKAFGVLSLIFASLMLLVNLPVSCGSLAGAGMSEAMLGMEFDLDKDDAPAAQVHEAAEALHDVYLGLGLIGLMLVGMSGWLIGVGVGQLKYRPWGRAQSVWWGGIGVGAVAAMVVIWFALIGPGYADFFGILADRSPELYKADGVAGPMVGRAFAWVGSILNVIVFLPYPLLLLILFRSDRLRRAMSGADEDLSTRASAFD